MLIDTPLISRVKYKERLKYKDLAIALLDISNYVSSKKRAVTKLLTHKIQQVRQIQSTQVHYLRIRKICS